MIGVPVVVLSASGSLHESTPLYVI